MKEAKRQKNISMHIRIHIHIHIHINERGQTGFYIHSSCPFSGKRRVRETYENSWLSGRKKHAKITEDYKCKIKEAKKAEKYIHAHNYTYTCTYTCT